jgi:hypothetical protein
VDLSQGNTLLISDTGHAIPEAEAAAAAGFQVVMRTDGVVPSTVGARRLAEQLNTARLPPAGAYGPFRGLYIGTEGHRYTDGGGRLGPDAIPQDPDVTQAIVLTEGRFGAVAGEPWTENPYVDDDLAPLKWYQQRGVPVTTFGLDPRPANGSAPVDSLPEIVPAPGFELAPGWGAPFMRSSTAAAPQVASADAPAAVAQGDAAPVGLPELLVATSEVRSPSDSTAASAEAPARSLPAAFERAGVRPALPHSADRWMEPTSSSSGVPTGVDGAWTGREVPVLIDEEPPNGIAAPAELVAGASWGGAIFGGGAARSAGPDASTPGASPPQGVLAQTGPVPARSGGDGRDGTIGAPPENLDGLPAGVDAQREGALRQRDIDYRDNLMNVLGGVDLSQGNTLLIGNTGHAFPEAEAAAAAGFQVVMRTDGVDPDTPGARQLAEQRNAAQLPPAGAYGPFRGLYIGTDAHRDTEGGGRSAPDAIPQDPDVTQAIVLTEGPFGTVAGEPWTVNPYKDDDLAPLTWYQERGIPVTEFGLDPRPADGSAPRNQPWQFGPGPGLPFPQSSMPTPL